MNLLFLGIRPSPALETRLRANQFGIFLDKRSAGRNALDMAVVALKSRRDLGELKRLREAHPRAWIAAVVTRRWVTEAALYSQLLAAPGKDDVWLASDWEPLLWFALERAIDRARLLGELARSRSEAAALREHYEELSSSSERLLRQLEKNVSLATDIQRALLPKSSPLIPGVSLSVKYVPAAGLGGDYYDLFELGDKRHYGLLLADSKTHGMAAALLSVLLKTRVDEVKDKFPDSSSFVGYLNRELRELHQKDLASLALLYGILDRGSLTLRFTAAGHLRPILWRGGRVETLVVPANPALGEIDHYSFREMSLQLKPGDLLVFHTDGLESALKTRDRSGHQVLVDLLSARGASPDPLEIQNELMGLVHRRLERKALEDDLTLIHLSVDGKALYLAANAEGPG